MVRKAFVISLVFLASGASAQTTDCNWVGNTWTCRTQPSTTQIPDYGAIMKSGMDSVPKYEASSPRPQSSVIVKEYEPIDVEVAVEQCELDWPAVQADAAGHPRRKQKAFFGGYLPESQRPQFMQICAAYMMGKMSVLKEK